MLTKPPGTKIRSAIYAGMFVGCFENFGTFCCHSCTGVEASADFNQKSSKPRRRISSIKSPHDVQSNSKDHLRDQRNAESGLSALEKMMDAGEGTLKPNHKKNSFHPYTKENSGTEGKYLRSCSDPMKLLEFLMNIDEPP